MVKIVFFSVYVKNCIHTKIVMYSAHPTNLVEREVSALAATEEVYSYRNASKTSKTSKISNPELEAALSSLTTVMGDRIDVVRCIIEQCAPDAVKELLPKREEGQPRWCSTSPYEVEAAGPWLPKPWERSWRLWVHRNYNEETLTRFVAGGGDMAGRLVFAAQRWLRTLVSSSFRVEDLEEDEAAAAAAAQEKNMVHVAPEFDPRKMVGTGPTLPWHKW